MASPHRATVSIEYDHNRAARIVERSIAREVDEIDDDRSRTTVDRVGPRLQIRIEADDLVALRAAMNTWLSLTDVAERVCDAGRIMDSSATRDP